MFESVQNTPLVAVHKWSSKTSELYLGSCQTSAMELLSVNNFAKALQTNVWQSPKYNFRNIAIKFSQRATASVNTIFDSYNKPQALNTYSAGYTKKGLIVK